MRPPRRLSRAPVAHAMIEHHCWPRILSTEDGGLGAEAICTGFGMNMPIERLENRS